MEMTAVLIKKKEEKPEDYKGIKILPRNDQGGVDWNADGLIIWRADLEILLKYNRFVPVFPSKARENSEESE